MPPPPPLVEELWEQILLRLPPDEPASLLRASLVCKQWRRIASRRGFLRRLAELHRAPPLLGFFHNSTGGPSFVPATVGSAFSFSVPGRDYTETLSPEILGCRHSRVLLLIRGKFPSGWIIVWEPTTEYKRRVPLHAVLTMWIAVGKLPFDAAVVCAVEGCSHSDCHGGPFRVVFVSSFRTSGGSITSVWEYSSETDAWSWRATDQITHSHVRQNNSLLIGKSLYFLCKDSEILKYDFDEQSRPSLEIVAIRVNGRPSLEIILVQEDGRLGFAAIQGSRLDVWSRKGQSIHDENLADARWSLRRSIDLKNSAAGLSVSAGGAQMDLLGFIDGTDVIFLRVEERVLTVELNSGRARRVDPPMKAWGWDKGVLFPFVTFYSPELKLLSQVGGKDADSSSI